MFRKLVSVISFILITLIFVVPASSRVGGAMQDGDFIKKQKEDFILKYSFFITSKESKELKNISTQEQLEEFVHRFWWGDKNGTGSRDPNPNTPGHELKNDIDKKIEDIKNEIFVADTDIPGTRFDNNGGLVGDMAHVYLFYGMPHYKERLPEGRYTAELMVWYYFDSGGRPLFRYLFYKNFGSAGYRLFKDYSAIIRSDSLYDPLVSPLKLISNRPMPAPDDLVEIWNELSLTDPNWIFRQALFEFSYFSDVNISDALRVPEPAEVVAKISKPIILGQPNSPKGVEIFESEPRSLLPAYIRASVSPDSQTFLMTIILYKNIDWQKEDNGYSASFNLRISFQNKKTLQSTEFFTGIKTQVISESDFKNRSDSGSLVIYPTILKNWKDGKETASLKEIISSLEPGQYIVNVYIRRNFTKKYNAWREEITIR